MYSPSISQCLITGAAAFAIFVSAVPVEKRGDAASFPLSNGFPDIQSPSSELTAIEIQAQGTLPNGPPPPGLAADDFTSLRLIAFNELFEVSYFTELLANITNDVEGYTLEDDTLRTFLINAVTAIIAQEELHALNANGALAAFNEGPISPCQYMAPVSDLQSAIGLASTFTDVVLGTLQDVATHAGQNGDAGLIAGVASVIGQEGEQNGFFRSFLSKIPSALPFLSASTREFAYSALNQNFIVPGSCPAANNISLPIFGVLNILTPTIAAQDQLLQFSFDGQGECWSAEGMSLVYINQQNVPIVAQIIDESYSNGVITFSAYFPYTANELNGLTIAAVTQGSGPFASPDDVAQATLYGPGLIEIN